MRSALPLITLCAAGILTACGAIERLTGARISDQQVDAAFKVGNPDNDGTFDMTEASRFGITREAFTAANPDNDGTLDKKEFVAAIRYQFEKANPDKDGTLDEKEAADAGIKSRSAFLKANPDNDGTLDLSEYLDALTIQAQGR